MSSFDVTRARRRAPPLGGPRPGGDAHVVGRAAESPSRIGRQRRVRPIFHLISVDHGETERLRRAIKELGGICLNPSDRYQARTDVTHCVIGSKSLHLGAPRPLSLKALGCLASGKPVVKDEYIWECQKAGRFLDNEDDFLPESTRHSREFALSRPGGKMFVNWTVSVIVSDGERQRELESVLRDGGATVLPHTPKSLTTTSVQDLRRLDRILTEPAYLDDVDFGSFMNSNVRGHWDISIYSFYYLIKFATDPRIEQRHKLEYFQIANPALVQKLHKPAMNMNGDISLGDPMVRRAVRSLESNSRRQLLFQADIPKRSLENDRNVPQRKRARPEVIDISDNDDEIQIVKDTKTALKRFVRRVNRPACLDYPKKPLVFIDLVSDDEDDDEVQIIEKERERQQRIELVTILESSSEPEPEPDSESDIEVTMINSPNIVFKEEVGKIGSSFPELQFKVSEMLENYDEEQMNVAKEEEDITPQVRIGEDSIEDITPELPAAANSSTNTASAIKVPITDAQPELAADVSDMQRVLQALLKRQQDTNECIDVENVKCRTLRFDAKGDQNDRRVSQKTAIGIDYAATYTMFDIMDRDRGSKDTNVTVGDLISAIDNISSLVDTRNYPQAKTMHRILTEYILGEEQDDDSLSLAHKGHELFFHTQCLHPPVTKTSRLYYLTIFRQTFDQNARSDHHFWTFFLSLVRRCVSRRDLRCFLALDIVISVMQRDVEFWWKHCHRTRTSDEETLLMLLFEKDSNVERHVAAFAAECRTAMESKDVQALRLFWRFLSMCGLLCSALDKDKNLGSLGRKDSLKYKFSRTLLTAFNPVLDSPRHLFIYLNQLRPSWVPLLVAKALLDQRYNMDINETSLEDVLSTKLQALSLQEKQISGGNVEEFTEFFKNLRIVMASKQLATFNYHTIHRSLAMEQKAAAGRKNPFLKISKLRNVKALPDVICLDSRITVDRKEFQDNVNCINSIVNKLKEGEDDEVKTIDDALLVNFVCDF